MQLAVLSDPKQCYYIIKKAVLLVYNKGFIMGMVYLCIFNCDNEGGN